MRMLCQNPLALGWTSDLHHLGHMHHAGYMQVGVFQALIVAGDGRLGESNSQVPEEKGEWAVLHSHAIVWSTLMLQRPIIHDYMSAVPQHDFFSFKCHVSVAKPSPNPTLALPSPQQ